MVGFAKKFFTHASNVVSTCECVMADFSKIGRSNVSRSKSHERRVAKWLTEWSGTEFRRRRVEGRDTATTMVEGTADVISVQDRFLFSIEAKWRVDFSLDHLLSNPCAAQFTKWWHQACYDAQLASREQSLIIYPMLFFKPAPTQNWMAFSEAALSRLRPTPLFEEYRNLYTPWFTSLTFGDYARLGPIEGDISHTKNKKLVKLTLDPAIFCRWDDFAASVDPQSCFYH